MDLLGQAIISTADYNLNFEEKKQALKRKLERLESMEIDVIKELEGAESRSSKKRKNEVQNWLNNVGRLKNDIGTMELEAGPGLRRIQLGKLIEKKTENVEDLIDQRVKFQGGLLLDVQECRGDALFAPELVGQEFQENFDKIQEFLMMDDVSVIGIWGMGGVGKTTLVAHIHNVLLQRQENVYWVTVSQDLSIYKLQNSIAKTIGFDLSNEDDLKKRAAKLSKALSEKQEFVLILDDLWNYFPLKEVGILAREKGCKLILTTRMLDVCRQMECQETIKVKSLPEFEAWQLFQDKLGKPLSLDVMEIAKSIASECAGLPLGIITIAASMRGADDICEWRNALRKLQESKVREGEMENEVFQALKFSYNRLNNSSLQQCFLYCGLYPEDHPIARDNVIEYLIDEGVIRGESRQAKLDEGHTMLNRLVRVCLLEEDSYFVKMHDLVRDMAIQIMEIDPRVVVKAGKELAEMPDLRNWSKNLVRISLMCNRIPEISFGYSPAFPNLSTLLLCENFRLRFIEYSFFEQLHGLKVLDLSQTGIEELPGSISYLVNLSALLLRECLGLRCLPSLAQLSALKKLDLYDSRVEKLPEGIEWLSNLSYLDLGFTYLELTPGILPKLSHMQFLALPLITVKEEEVASLRKLETLKCIFYDVGEFNKYRTSTSAPNLSSYQIIVGQVRERVLRFITTDLKTYVKTVTFCECGVSDGEDAPHIPKDVQYLRFIRCDVQRIISCLKIVTELKRLKIDDCDGTECCDIQRFISRSIPLSTPQNTFSLLQALEIHFCRGIKKLFPPVVLANLQNLEAISVDFCENMEELIAMDEEQETHDSNGGNIAQLILPKLQHFDLRHLPQMKSIYGGKLVCNSLKVILVVECPKLKQMPLSLITLVNGQPIPLPSLQIVELYPEELWESIEFERPDAKNILRSIQRPVHWRGVWKLQLEVQRRLHEQLERIRKMWDEKSKASSSSMDDPSPHSQMQN
ncbi:probable disease resistance protein At4g27220 isoform X3 [Hevea brasiliensis]|uniref:probable disease resistance protein At4g27220 isoform X3 n=1 Tax=Hevea brasiliensis TaxID=3981 RepID=UPI0025EF7795|nr:probable disease resistance protein At4g27220 isoform X3 [Hevea brasiliensis]